MKNGDYSAYTRAGGEDEQIPLLAKARRWGKMLAEHNERLGK
jgi:hypothetical protein